MKKIALCLYGKYNNRLSPNSGYDGSQYIKGNIIHGREVDVFIHSWDFENQTDILNEYGSLVKSSLFEEQIDFGPLVDQLGIDREFFSAPGGQKFRTIENSFSFYYSRGKAIELKRSYEEKMAFRYDVVVCSRFDLGQMDRYNGYQDFKVSEIVFDENLDMKYIYCANWDQLNAGYTDMWFYSSSENIDVLASFFEMSHRYYQHDSEYLRALEEGWPDSNADDEFSNEINRNEKTKKLMKYSASLGHNNHFMHKWFFLDSGLYEKSRFLSSHSNIFCALTIVDSPEHLAEYILRTKSYSRVVGKRFLLVSSSVDEIQGDFEILPVAYEQSMIERLRISLLELRERGFSVVLLESAGTFLQGTIDYKKIKSAIKFVVREKAGMPFRNGFDFIQLDKPKFSFGIRTISDRSIYWSPPFCGKFDLSIPAIYKIES